MSFYFANMSFLVVLILQQKETLKHFVVVRNLYGHDDGLEMVYRENYDPEPDLRCSRLKKKV
jgi:hypothetical protein